MKKIYNKKIIQYTIEGKILNIFLNKDEASTHTNTHPDSIIACCKGKYKTAGGFVFRFEGEAFNLHSPVNTDKVIKCKICDSTETLRSFAGHLRWVHPDYNTKKYISEFGEFRPKYINQNLNKESSNIECKICNEKMMHNRQLMHHITKKHKDITKEEYIIKYVYNNVPPLCKCGCGEIVTFLPNGKNCDLNKETYHRDYIKGHWDWPIFSNISNQSKEELELLEFIKSICSFTIIENEKNILPKQEIDIYIPELNIGIEYNGLYWHSEKAGRGKYYHLNKTLQAKKHNIRLIQIFSDEWLNSKEKVKNKLISILGGFKNKIYARNCIVKEINDPKIKNEFLEKYHIQGKDKSQIKLGLYFKEELVGVMTFCSPRIALGGKTKTKEWELSRYATSTNVVGGASKLLKFFIKNYKPELIYSYSDNRWSDWENNMYLKIGFKFKSLSQPGYYYTKNFTERLHRFNFRKNKLKELGINVNGKTEFEIMDSLKYSRVWDCGVARFEFKFN